VPDATARVDCRALAAQGQLLPNVPLRQWQVLPPTRSIQVPVPQALFIVDVLFTEPTLEAHGALAALHATCIVTHAAEAAGGVAALLVEHADAAFVVVARVALLAL
jgi:hypothetical protein